jgi:hypothetical protein
MTGIGLTWTVVKQGTVFNDGTNGWRAELWKGIGTASTGTAAITFDAATTGAAWTFLQLADAHPSDPVVSGQTTNGQSNVAATTATADLPSSPAASSVVIGCFGAVGSGGFANALGFTVISANYSTPTTRLGALYNATPSAATVSATMPSSVWGMVAAEISASSIGAGETSSMGAIPI